MQHTESNPTQGLGIAGLIVGIFSIFFSIIPCTLPLGIILAVIGLILTIVGLNQATKLNAQKGLLIAGLITSILGILIALLWGLAFTGVANQNNIFEKIELFEDNIKNNDNAFETTDELDSIQFESDKTMQDLEQHMEHIEQERPAVPDTTDNTDSW